MTQDTATPPIPQAPIRKDLMAVFSQRPRPLDYVLPGLVAGTVGMLFAAGSTGKSFLALQTAFSVALGKDSFNIWGSDPAQGDVVYVVLEDPDEVLDNRLYEIASRLRPDEQESVAEHLHVLNLYGTDFDLATKANGTITPGAGVDTVLSYCQGYPPRLIFVDTFNRSLGGLNENDNGEMGKILSYIAKICRVTHAAVILLHHVGKNAGRAGETDAQAGRGASALIDNCRWAAGLAVMTEEDAERRGITTPRIRKSWVRMDLSKINYGLSEDTRWLNRCDGGLLYGDEPPDVVDTTKKSKK